MRIDRPESEPLCYAPHTVPYTLQTIEPSALVSPSFSMQQPYLPSRKFPLSPSPYVPASYRLPEVRSQSAALQCTLPVQLDHSSTISLSTALPTRNTDASIRMRSSQQEVMYQRIISTAAGSLHGDPIIVLASLSPPTAREKPDMDHGQSKSNGPTPLVTKVHSPTVRRNLKRVPQACL